MLDTIWRDLRHGVRVLTKNPGFAAVAVLVGVLALTGWVLVPRSGDDQWTARRARRRLLCWGAATACVAMAVGLGLRHAGDKNS